MQVARARRGWHTPAALCIRRVVQEGQNARPLQDKATSISSPQDVQRARAKPWARMSGESA